MSGVSPAFRMHNSIDSPAGQARSAGSAPSSALVERLGSALVAQGFVATPVALLRGYARLGLSDGELAVVLQIWTYWRDETLPCPAVSTLTAQLGKTERQVQQILAGLRKRGLLTVHPRHDRERGQLSNAYDLGPLLRALETLPPGAARPVLGVLPATGEGVQPIAPNEDPGIRSLVLVSDPPDPPAKPALPEDLSGWLSQIGKRLGDAAPASSQTRAARLLASCGLDPRAFRACFDQAAQIATDALPVVRHRGQAGAPNGMPYCFAVLEALLEGRPEPPPRAWSRRAWSTLALRAQAPSEQACAPSAPTVDSDGHPLWPAVATALAGMLAPSIFAQRVRPLRSRRGSDGVLELVAPDYAAARWIEARLGNRINEALVLAAADLPAWRVTEHPAAPGPCAQRSG